MIDIRSVRFAGALTALTLAVAACSDGSPAEPDNGPATLRVDASTDWAFVRLGPTAEQVAITDAEGSTAWDIGFFATSVMLNGGAAGPGGVEGYCVCQNDGATDAEVLAMTPASELADFEAVTAASNPPEAAWKGDVLAPAIAGWYAYNPTTHQVSADPTRAWKIRLAEASAPAYAKLHVIAVEGATQSSAGRVTIEYAVQSAPGEPLGETRTAVLDATSGVAYFDLGTGTSGDESDWDIALESYAIRVNGGVSGPGAAGAVLAGQSFEEITDAGDAPARIYRGDAFGGAFAEHRWYRYNLTGSHDISPTFDVYLIRRGDELYKVQLIGYYDEEGESRRVSFRYERISG